MPNSCLAQVYTVAGRLREAIEIGERALSTFESTGNYWWAGRTLWHLSVAANYRGEWDASLSYCRRALEYGTALRDVRLKAVSWWRMGVAYIQRGDLERGQRCCNELLLLSTIPRDAAMAKAARGYAEIKAGRIDVGIAELSAAVSWFESSQSRFTQLNYALWLAEGHLCRGDPANARPLLDQALTRSRAAGYRHFEGRARWLMGDCLAAEDPAAAEDHARQAMEILQRVGAQNDLAKAMVTRAALRRAAGDVATARQLLDRAYWIFRTLGTHGEFARVEAALAALRPA